MPILRGREAEQRRRDQLPDKIRRILRGAARAGAAVIAEEARVQVTSDAVRQNLVEGRVKDKDGTISVRITVKDGWARSVGIWLEYGTSPHFISIDPKFAEGRTAERVNRLDGEAAKNGREGPGRSLSINGKLVGKTVFHPGTAGKAWLRTARDVKASEAMKVAQDHITAGLRRSRAAASGGDE